MANAGIRAYLSLNGTNVSTWLDGITPSSDADELDGTTFQPGVAAPIKEIIAGFRTRALSLSSKWIPAAEIFFSQLEGQTGVAYVYGPLGNDDDMIGISGLCTCLSWTGPIATVDGIITATAELRATTREVGTFDAGDITPIPTATGATAGIPGTFTPSGSMTPANNAAMTAGPVVASPATAWTTGQYVATADGVHQHWNATAWITGNAP
jgi:hypothetical protein